MKAILSKMNSLVAGREEIVRALQAKLVDWMTHAAEVLGTLPKSGSGVGADPTVLEELRQGGY